MRYTFIAIIILLILQSSFKIEAQENDLRSKLDRMSFDGYGSMTYHHFNWQTDSIKRDGIDNERLIFELKYAWNDKLRLNTEIEFEHGGTGSSVEFDRFEEFGEFEFDIHKGGEVLIEQMNLEFDLNTNLNLKVGRLKIPFGMMFKKGEPTDYVTVLNSEMESYILPENWTDNGFMFNWNPNKKYKIYLSIINGLDGSAFNSANWIKRGNQRRFELANAENFALALRFDFSPNDNLSFGISTYVGNTTGNRPKPDLKVDTYLSMNEFHFQMKKQRFHFNAMALIGFLQNSEALSNQNRNLSNNLNVKRTPVGSSAFGYFVELGYDAFGNSSKLKFLPNPLTIYCRYDYYDTMFKTEGIIFNNPRWERSSFAFGLRYKIINEVHLKTQFTSRKVGAAAPTSINGGRIEQTFNLGFAFEF